MTARRWWSQHGEDKKIAGIFKSIGTTNQVAVEFGAGDGRTGSNTAHVRDRGWTVHLFDAEPSDPVVTAAAITAENVNAIFAAAGIPSRFDLLSIDIDGNDLWVWKALTYRPRVVVIEYNPRWGRRKSRTVSYDPDRQWDGTIYYGASVKALEALATEKGYALVAGTRSNLIFVRKGLMPAPMPVSIKWPQTFKRPDPSRRKWVAYP